MDGHHNAKEDLPACDGRIMTLCAVPIAWAWDTLKMSSHKDPMPAAGTAPFGFVGTVPKPSRARLLQRDAQQLTQRTKVSTHLAHA